MSSPELRNRKPPAAETPPPKPKRAADEEEEETGPLIGFVDILRVLSGILLLSCLFSWFVTDGESLTWGYRPAISRWKTWKGYFQPIRHFTPDELLRYDGTDPSLPIYVAVNGSVFDVSSNPHTYGPGGAYHFFAGRDAARAFVSGCFKDDLTHDLRGLEAMYVVGKAKEEDDAQLAEINRLEKLKREGKLRIKLHPDAKGVGKEEGGEEGEEVEGGVEGMEEAKGEGRLRWLKGQREKRWREAREKVEKGVRHWDNFFRGHEKYFFVGVVEHPSLEGTPVRELCKKGKGGKP